MGFEGAYSRGIHETEIPDGTSLLVKFDFVPNTEDIDGVIGYAGSETTITGLESLFIRLGIKDGQLKAINGTEYQAVSQVNYIKGKKYFVKMFVDLASAKYDVLVTLEDGDEILLADDYSFAGGNPGDIGKVVLNSRADKDFTVIEHSVIGYIPPTVSMEAEWMSVDTFEKTEGLHYLGKNSGIIDIEFDFIPYADCIDGVVGYSYEKIKITSYACLSLCSALIPTAILTPITSMKADIWRQIKYRTQQICSIT